MAQSSTKQRLLYCFVGAAFVTAIGFASLGYIQSKVGQRVPVKSMGSWQQADAPLGYPLADLHGAPAPFDSRFIQLTAFERAAVPSATRMAAPMGSERGALTYNAQPFWSDNTKRGGHHTGDDINGIGGMNTDLGDPIFAIANGLVVYRGEPSHGWGKTLMLAHRSPEGQILLSMYAHLHQNYCPFGELIHLGEPIGTVGTANMNYPAHLHLEMRDSTGIHIGAGYTAHPGECISADQTIQSHQKSPPEHIYATPLSIILAEKQKNQSDGIVIKNETNVTK